MRVKNGLFIKKRCIPQNQMNDLITGTLKKIKELRNIIKLTENRNIQQKWKTL